MNEANYPKYNPFFIPKMIADIASGHVSMEYEFHGPNYGVVSACASSNNAIIDAFNLIRLGKADAFVTQRRRSSHLSRRSWRLQLDARPLHP